MGIFNQINDKKDEFTQTETNQNKQKNNSKINTNEFILQEVKEINIEYKGKENESVINENNLIIEEIKNFMFIFQNYKKLENKKKVNISNKKYEASIKNIKSKYILKQIFNTLNKNKFLGIIKYNKQIQRFLNLDKNDYKEHFEIEIELKPILNQYGKFINILKKEDKSNIHIYFDNNNKEEIKRNFLIKNENVSKINILIDYKVKSLSNLFSDCHCIKSISFKKFNRKKLNLWNICFIIVHL